MSNLQIFPVRKTFNEVKEKWQKVPAIPKGQDWHTYKGPMNDSANIGIVIPKNVVVFDLDTHKGVSCDDVETMLGCSLDWDNAELQETISGGRHYAFALPEGSSIKQGSDLLGVVGFDTRCTGKGWICSGEGYEDLTMIGLPDALCDETWPELPAQVLLKLSDDISELVEGDNDLLAAVAAETLELSNADIENYINKLSSDQSEDGDTWLKIGMAIYHETKGSDFGWEQFDKFSQLSPENYDHDMNLRRWESFGRSQKTNPVTFATIIKMVGGKGVVAVEQLEQSEINTVEDITIELEKLANCKLDNLQLDTALSKISAKYKELTGTAPSKTALNKELKRLRKHKISGSYVDDYVFLTNCGEYMSRNVKTTMGPRSFDVLHNRDTPPNADGDMQSATTFSNNIIECAHESMYAPCFNDFFSHGGVTFFNTYKPNDIKRVKVGKTDTVSRIKKHIAHLLPDKIEQDIVINYLAHNVQYPGVKIQWAIVLQGVQGDGKSLLAEMMQHVLGLTNVRTMNPQTLESNFTGWAVGQCMTFIEELKINNSLKYDILNNMKPYITNTAIEVTCKGKDPMVAINTTNYFALTNFKDAIPIDDNDRRYCILFSQWQNKDKLIAWMDENPNHYHDLYEAMRDNIGELLEWLSSYEIPQSFLDMKRAPITTAKNTMINMSKSDGYLLVEDALNEFEGDQINDQVVNVTKLVSLSENAFADGYNHFPKTSALKNILLDMGYHNIGRYKNTSRKNQLIYCKDDTKQAIDFKEMINNEDF